MYILIHTIYVYIYIYVYTHIDNLIEAATRRREGAAPLLEATFGGV